MAAEGEATVLFYGRHSAEKGIGLLRNAWRQLRAAATLSILGMAGPLRACVGRAAGGGVRLLQPVAHADVPAIVADHDVVCCPSSVEESLCRTALEARLLGRVVVAGQSGAILEVMRGYPLTHPATVRPDDATAIDNIAQGLKAALRDRRPLTEAEQEAEKLFRRRFLPETFVPAFRRLKF